MTLLKWTYSWSMKLRDVLIKLSYINVAIDIFISTFMQSHCQKIFIFIFIFLKCSSILSYGSWVVCRDMKYTISISLQIFLTFSFKHKLVLQQNFFHDSLPTIDSDNTRLPCREVLDVIFPKLKHPWPS